MWWPFPIGCENLDVYVKTPSRLHFGMVDPSGSLDRRYGSVGLAIDRPNFELKAERSDKLQIAGPEEYAERAKGIASRVTKSYDLPSNAKIRIIRGIPSHVGLSSTTQLTLAIGRALTKLNGMEVSVVELADGMGRGRSSGIGTYAFEFGGLIVDGGRGNGFPPLVSRLDFPEDWRFLVVTPEVGRGPSETEEEGMFERIRGSVEVSRRIAHLILMGMLPSAAGHDIENFGRVLTEIDRLVGRIFSSQQGGIFHGKATSDLVDRMLEMGAYGAGQSSWGPTVYGLAEDEVRAGEIKEGVEEFAKEEGLRADMWIVGPNNRGAGEK